ncbi:MAG: hypothetical protein ACRCZY_04435 [Phocaeicola sp.]
MKKTDIGLLVLSLIVLFLLIGTNSVCFAKIVLGLFLIIFALYWKIAPFKSELTDKYKLLFLRFEKIALLLLAPFKLCPKMRLGNRIQLETSYLVIFTIIILLLIIL